MKQLLYIIIAFGLLWSCSQPKRKAIPKMQKTAAEPKAELKSNKDKNIFKKEVVATNDASLETEEILEETPDTTEKIALTNALKTAFAESVQQKVQQVYDIATLYVQDSISQEEKTYALSSIKHFYQPKKESLTTKITALNRKKADSIVVSKIELIRLKTIEKNLRKGHYKATIITYKNGNKVSEKSKKVTVLLELITLYIDKQTYTTIDSKLLDITD